MIQKKMNPKKKTFMLTALYKKISIQVLQVLDAPLKLASKKDRVPYGKHKVNNIRAVTQGCCQDTRC